jgi:signal transduction histidine kinase
MNGHGKLIDTFGPNVHQPNTSRDKTDADTEQRLRLSTAELAKAHEDLTREISKLTRVEQALRDSERRVNAILDTNRSIVAEREVAEASFREASSRLAQSSDVDHRIARELHDSTSPALAGVIARLYVVKNQAGKLDGEGSVALIDSLALAEHIAQEIRSLSERLESPILDRSGLVPAIRSFAQEFEKQSGLRVELDLAELNRLPPTIERTLFRIVEEVLAEIRLYSRSRRAEIRLTSTGQDYKLEVGHKVGDSIEGSGIFQTATSRLGIKLAGPRERVRQLGGDLVITTDSGIAVRAVVPMRNDSNG